MKKRYKILFVILLLLLVTIALVTILRWRAWFYMPPEQTYSVPSVPDRITLTYGANALNERTLTWRCDTLLQKSSVQIVRGTEHDTLCIPADGKMVYSRKGKQAFYYLHLSRLKPNSNYSYRVKSGDNLSDWYHFSTQMDAHRLEFLLFGDIQDEVGGDSRKVFLQAQSSYPQACFWAFVGDAIERPEDVYWNVFFSSIENVAGQKPIMMCTGNHEYVKGLFNSIDTRWTYTFKNPNNGDGRHLGRNYYIDFPLLRYVVLDTEGLQTLVDYESTRSWLNEVLSTNKHRWSIVMMHHPVHSGSLHRNNLLIRWILRPVFEKYKVDLVIAGHDHSYMRRNTGSTTPLYVNCNSSNKYYLSNCNLSSDRICSGHRLYHYIEITDNTLQMKSYLVDNNSLYDDVLLCKTRSNVLVKSVIGRQSELIDVPEHSNKALVKLFLKLKENRLHKYHLE